MVNGLICCATSISRKSGHCVNNSRNVQHPWAGGWAGPTLSVAQPGTFLQGGSVTWCPCDCSFRLSPNNWNWCKVPVKILASVLRKGPWVLRPHSGCDTASVSAMLFQEGGPGRKVRRLVVHSNLSAFQPLLFLSSDELISCWADGQASTQWSRCQGSMGQRIRDTVARLRRSSVGWRKIVCWCRTQESSHSLQGAVNGRVNKAGVNTSASDMSAVICCSMNQDKVTVRSVVAPASQPEPQQAASRMQCVMSTFCEVTRGVGGTWATCLTLLRGIWAWRRRAGFRCCGWFSARSDISS